MLKIILKNQQKNLQKGPQQNLKLSLKLNLNLVQVRKSLQVNNSLKLSLISVILSLKATLIPKNNIEKVLTDLYDTRKDFYRNCSNIVIDGNDKTIDQIINESITKINELD